MLEILSVDDIADIDGIVVRELGGPEEVTEERVTEYMEARAYRNLAFELAHFLQHNTDYQIDVNSVQLTVTALDILLDSKFKKPGGLVN